MPKLRRLAPVTTAVINPVGAFKWSEDGSGMNSMIGLPHYSTRREAARAWHEHRRAVWARTHRFHIPQAAVFYDAMRLECIDRIRSAWQYVEFDTAAVLAALAADREALASFAAKPAARQIQDYLDVLRADLDEVERTALALHGTPHIRPYPHHLSTRFTYGQQREPAESTATETIQ